MGSAAATGVADSGSCAALDSQGSQLQAGSSHDSHAASGSLLPVSTQSEEGAGELGPLTCPLPAGLYNVSRASAQHKLPWLPDPVTQPAAASWSQRLTGWLSSAAWALLVLLLIGGLVSARQPWLLRQLLPAQATPPSAVADSALTAAAGANGAAAAVVATAGLATISVQPAGKGKKGKKGKNSAAAKGQQLQQQQQQQQPVGSASSGPSSSSAAAASNSQEEGHLASNGQQQPRLVSTSHAGGMSSDLPLSPSLAQLLADPGSHHSQLSSIGSDSGLAGVSPPLGPAPARSWVDTDGAVVIGRLRVGPAILGYGSAGELPSLLPQCHAVSNNCSVAKGCMHSNNKPLSAGTIVYEGVLDGRPVAVKRLLRQFYDLARKEIEVRCSNADPSKGMD